MSSPFTQNERPAERKELGVRERGREGKRTNVCARGTEDSGEVGTDSQIEERRRLECKEGREKKRGIKTEIP